MLAAKDTPRTDLSISDEMVPSIVAEDGIALRVYCWLAGGSGVIISQPEKHLWSQDAVETLLDGPVAKGVRKFRTPSGYTLSRTL